MSERRFWVTVRQVTAKGQKWESWGKEKEFVCPNVCSGGGAARALFGDRLGTG